MSDLAQRISALSSWVLEQGLHETPLREFITNFCDRLRGAGIPVDRLGLGGMLLHPVSGARELVWK